MGPVTIQLQNRYLYSHSHLCNSSLVQLMFSFTKCFKSIHRFPLEISQSKCSFMAVKLAHFAIEFSPHGKRLEQRRLGNLGIPIGIFFFEDQKNLIYNYAPAFYPRNDKSCQKLSKSSLRENVTICQRGTLSENMVL